jgi:hypothetical protein
MGDCSVRDAWALPPSRRDLAAARKRLTIISIASLPSAYRIANRFQVKVRGFTDVGERFLVPLAALGRLVLQLAYPVPSEQLARTT